MVSVSTFVSFFAFGYGFGFGFVFGRVFVLCLVCYRLVLVVFDSLYFSFRIRFLP